MPELKEEQNEETQAPEPVRVNVMSLNKRLTEIEADYKDFQEKCESVLSLVVGRITELQEEITVLKTPAPKKAVKTIQSVETHNGEKEPEPRDDGMYLNTKDQINSMVTLICLLPPNMVDENNRQPLINVKAICGFAINEEMMDRAYAQIGA
jgi:hypothetical protein